MLRKVAHAGASSAFATASEDLSVLAEAQVSREQVQRWTKRVGQERMADTQRIGNCRCRKGSGVRFPRFRQSPACRWMAAGFKFVIANSPPPVRHPQGIGANRWSVVA
jgi:hypothetical protein